MRRDVHKSTVLWGTVVLYPLYSAILAYQNEDMARFTAMQRPHRSPVSTGYCAFYIGEEWSTEGTPRFGRQYQFFSSVDRNADQGYVKTLKLW
ncbi:MAG: hypothetical protein HYU29_02665 [Chloroflexi bacterium]|nr:hypothetical protein [Chloroflexota bacterium]